ncbi:MAG: SDR family oxidoreductase [Saprospiraceae bacterium]|nr:SDR family oxidoreductase [Saprospiraceae bacterium]
MNIAVTGAGKGLGLEVVKRYVQGPEHIVWACSRNVDQLMAIGADNLFTEALDLENCSIEMIEELFGRHMNHLDILIHNAGTLVNLPFEQTELDVWRRVFEVNLFSAIKVSKALLPFLKKSHQAHIVHIGSMGGFQGSSKFPGLSAYSASKAALANLTECMAEELKNDGIHVNCLALGAVNTEMLRQAFPGYQAPVESAQIADFICRFSIEQRPFFNGKILPVAASTP